MVVEVGAGLATADGSVVRAANNTSISSVAERREETELESPRWDDAELESPVYD